ncbi:replication initiation protein [Paraburkholderia sp. EG285A]|uniref:replication initiation protein n=1 Tax=Paraburkholderia sp. EG285A TaxID=3237009 RepID=UPI0034D337FD
MSKDISLWNAQAHRAASGMQVRQEVRNLTWVSAQVLSVIYFIAYSNLALANVTDTGSRYASHEIDRTLFAWLMGVDSGDVDHLQRMLRNAHQVTFEETRASRAPRPSSEVWMATQFVQSVGTTADESRFRVEVWIDLLRYLRSQESPGTLPFEFQPDLSSKYARALYLNLSERERQGHGSIEWIPLDVVRAWPGASRASTARTDYFLRKVLEPAIREINERSDVEIECETAPDEPGSKDISVRFLIRRKDPTAMGWEYLRTRSQLFFTLADGRP